MKKYIKPKTESVYLGTMRPMCQTPGSPGAGNITGDPGEGRGMPRRRVF